MKHTERPEAGSRRAERMRRRRERSERVVLVLELITFVAGASVTWSQYRLGQPIPRPALITLVAGAVGLVVTTLAIFLGPRLRPDRYPR